MSENAGLRRPEPLIADGAALFLDLDGTLAAIAARPRDVGPLASRNALIRALGERLSGRLAVVSGRTIEEIDRILDGAAPAAAGVHGLERRRGDGSLIRAQPSRDLPSVRAALEALAAAWPGVLVEDKGLGVAIHYRGAPQTGPEIVHAASVLAAGSGLHLQLGDHVAELRTVGQNKGEALRAFMAEPPFAGARPIFVGDDLTDEDGFTAARALGGFGVLVGAVRPTAASRRLGGVDDVLTWLREAVDGLRSPGPSSAQ
jgi:trehalose 6-phosphate phosphatase